MRKLKYVLGLMIPIIVFIGCYKISDDSASVKGEKPAVVQFKDENLEKTIRGIMGKEDDENIGIEDAEKVIEINAVGEGIVDLSGIEFFVNLQRLDITDNNISDFAPLKELKKIKELSLINCSIQGLEDLRGLSNLEKLNIGNFRRGRLYSNKIENLEPILELENLKELELNCSDVSLEGIGKLSTLERLGLAYCFELSSLEEIEKLKNLKSLDIRYTKVEDLAPLRGINLLEELDISNIISTDLEPLYNLKNLKKLRATKVIHGDVYEKLHLKIPECEIEY